MNVIILLALGCLIRPARSTILASTGYLASNPPVRDFLITSGVSDKIRSQSSALYAISGFGSSGAQGTGRRHAIMNSHDILEEEKFRKRLLEETTHSRDGKRVYSERLFSVLNQMDRKTCIGKLLCEIGADHNSYGMIGTKISQYLRSVPPVTWNSATFAYIQSFRSGLQSGKEGCARYYGTCSYDLRRVMQYAWLLIHPINFH